MYTCSRSRGVGIHVATRLTLGALALLAGCVSPPKRPEPVAVTTVAPRCGSPKACEALWIDAQTWVSNLSGMRLRLVTDNRIETFGATSYSRMGGVVTKYPIDDKTYEIRVSFECYRSTECADLKNAATNTFNSTLAR